MTEIWRWHIWFAWHPIKVGGRWVIEPWDTRGAPPAALVEPSPGFGKREGVMTGIKKSCP